MQKKDEKGAEVASSVFVVELLGDFVLLKYHREGHITEK